MKDKIPLHGGNGVVGIEECRLVVEELQRQKAGAQCGPSEVKEEAAKEDAAAASTDAGASSSGGAQGLGTENAGDHDEALMCHTDAKSDRVVVWDPSPARLAIWSKKHSQNQL